MTKPEEEAGSTSLKVMSHDRQPWKPEGRLTDVSQLAL